MAADRAFAGFAVLVFGAAMTASVANAVSPCSHRACKDEVAASGLSGHARGTCIRHVMADCRAGRCSCTGGSPPCSCGCGNGGCPTTTTLPCSLCFVTVTDQCLGRCSTDADCGNELNVLCLTVTELQSLGITCDCPTTTTTLPGSPSGAFLDSPRRQSPNSHRVALFVVLIHAHR